MFAADNDGGIFGGDGVPDDPSSPPVDSNDNPLRETLLVAYPSPGHMRVARATFDSRTGHVVEQHEEYREPAADEVEFLKRKGIVAGPGSVVQSRGAPDPNAYPRPLAQRLGAVELPAGPRLPALPGDPGGLPPMLNNRVLGKGGFPWVKVGVALTVGAAGFWAVNKFVLPRFGGGKRKRAQAPAEE